MPPTMRAAKWGTAWWPMSARRAVNSMVVSMPLLGEQVTDTDDAGGRSAMACSIAFSGTSSQRAASTRRTRAASASGLAFLGALRDSSDMGCSRRMRARVF